MASSVRADTLTLGTCPDSTVYENGTCYKPCKPGYYGSGGACWEYCKDGYRDIGAVCHKDGSSKPKDSYGRGAGSPLRCDPDEDLDGALCYKDCKDGYQGKGPVCWNKCKAGYQDDGALCRRDAHIITKDSYGRGAGQIRIKCKGSETRQDGLCYKECKDGYKGKGPVCWRQCPDGYKDDGGTCRRDADIDTKKSYGRGAGVALHGCPAGQEKQDGLCYQQCKEGYQGFGPVCWKACGKNETDDGALCRTFEEKAKGTYARTPVVVAASCTTKSFRKDAPRPGDPKVFTMAIMSDPQLPWWTEKDAELIAGARKCGGRKLCVIEESLQANENVIKAINDVQNATASSGGVTSRGLWPKELASSGGSKIEKPEGVIINGDLTAYWHPEQYDMFMSLYGDPDRIKLPVYPGLGNHDYANNVSDCEWPRDAHYPARDTNGCAKNAADFIRTMVNCKTVATFPNSRVQSFENDSLAYSWNIGGYHFIQLNNYPTYQRDAINIKTATDWLKTDVAKATEAGLKIVLNFHDPGEHWSPTDPGFQRAIASPNVVVAFAGHIHDAFGRCSEKFSDPSECSDIVIPKDVSGLSSDHTIPLFLSGSAMTNKFLLAEFAPDHIHVAVIDSKDGKPSFVTNDPGDLSTVDLSVPHP